MGRPKKVVPKTKKLKLTAEQKRYATVLKGINDDLGHKQAALKKIDDQLAKLNEQRRQIQTDATNLETTKRGLEGILSKLPPPASWESFTKYVYEYHYHYHQCPNCHCCGCKCKPIYVYPWWQYYNGGGYIYTPTYTQIASPQFGGNFGGLNGGLTSANGFTFANHNANLSPASSVVKLTSTVNSGVLPALNTTTCEALPNASVMCSSLAPSTFGSVPSGGFQGAMFDAKVENSNFTMTYTGSDTPVVFSDPISGDGEAKVKEVLSEFGFFAN